jgi:hypothetical protein
MDFIEHEHENIGEEKAQGENAQLPAIKLAETACVINRMFQPMPSFPVPHPIQVFGLAGRGTKGKTTGLGFPPLTGFRQRSTLSGKQRSHPHWCP